jgi:hypothetical protein
MRLVDAFFLVLKSSCATILVRTSIGRNTANCAEAALKLHPVGRPAISWSFSAHFRSPIGSGSVRFMSNYSTNNSKKLNDFCPIWLNFQAHPLDFHSNPTKIHWPDFVAIAQPGTYCM